MKCHFMVPTFSVVKLNGKVHGGSTCHLAIAWFSLEHLLLDDAVKHPSAILQCLQQVLESKVAELIKLLIKLSY